MSSSAPPRDIAIAIRSLSKSYTIVHDQEKHITLAEAMLARLKDPLRRPRKETFWALKDVSFDISRGEVVGIIGRNGAGKSTLLKILSRITEPTAGEIDLYGRVGSLLEVGTGFHPELTGRENIYLNGAILGMRKAEIERQFDAMVDFSGVEKFLDTPVKRYSSGMYVRLAFAVAAHLNPEILVVDEVLAVGDAEFQKKCLGKMKDVATSGRTILFVSHNMAAVTNLCTSAIVLRNGELTFHGRTDQAVQHYMDAAAARGGSTDGAAAGSLAISRPAWARPYITSARILGDDGRDQNCFAMPVDLMIELSFEVPAEAAALRQPIMGVVLNHETRGTVGGVNMRMSGFDCRGPHRSATLRCMLPRLPLLQGQYNLDLWLGDGPQDVDCLMGCLTFTVEPSDIYGTGRTPFADLGTMFLTPRWEVVAPQDSAVAPARDPSLAASY
jgi:lipopolysaccharide transport system ATP-binding protein